MKYASVIEKTETGYSAYVPDLPGLGVAGETLEEIRQLLREAVAFHLEGLREDGQPIPPATVEIEYVEAAA